jgi:hypothetical protein
MTQFMNRHATELLLDATQDPALYGALMTPTDAATAPAAERTLQDWARRIIQSAGESVRAPIVPTALGTASVLGNRPDPPPTLDEALRQGGQRTVGRTPPGAAGR